MRGHEDEIREAGAKVAAVGLGDMHYGRLFKEKSGIGFPLLVDEDRQAYRAVDLGSAPITHMLRRDNFAARKRAQAAGHRQHRMGQHPFQLGASFVFGPGDVDRFVHLSETFGDNAPVSDLIEELG